MPLYDYECKCGYQEKDRLSRPDKKEICPECGENMNRLFSGKIGICMGVGAYGYYDENLETYVNTNKQKRQVMKEKGVTEKFGKGWI